MGKLGIPESAALWARSSDRIWTDPYIARNLLAAHLDPRTDAASRGPVAVEAAVAWIDAAWRSAGNGGDRLLDLGCGPGFYAEAFRDRGYRVVGIDVNRASLRHARRSARFSGRSIAYRRLDYLRDPLPGPFDLACCIYCDFGALVPDERSVFLRAVGEALAPGGRLFLDVFGPAAFDGIAERRDWKRIDGADFWSPRPHFLLEEERLFPEASARCSRTVVVEDGRRARDFINWDTSFDEASLGRELAAYGFELESVERGLVPGNDFASDDVLFAMARRGVAR